MSNRSRPNVTGSPSRRSLGSSPRSSPSSGRCSPTGFGGSRTSTLTRSRSSTGPCCRAGPGTSAPTPRSGKHRTTGTDVQVACTLSGRPAWISDATPGSTHDAESIRMTGILDDPDHPAHLGDKGHLGPGMLTPVRKPPGGKLLDEHKEFNKSVDSIRYQIERTIAHLKTWRILHIDYRRPLATFTETIDTVIALHFYQNSF